MDKDTQSNHVKQMYSYVKNKYAYSSKVEETDFYQFVFDNYDVNAHRKETVIEVLEQEIPQEEEQ